MTLAGTRPPTVDEWDKYELHHRARLATKPGLTGMWQVSGRSNITDFEEVVKLDNFKGYRIENKSKSLAWSSVVLAFENSKRILEEVKKPKALGDIRGVSYIYPILWRLGLIRVPEAIEKKMGKQR